MRTPKLPPKRWEYERNACRHALKQAMAYRALGGAEYFEYAHKAAAWAVLGWERDNWRDNCGPNCRHALHSKVRWLNWLTSVEKGDAK